MDTTSNYTVFVGHTLLHAGDLLSVAQAIKAHLKKSQALLPLIFQDSNGRQIDIDVRGSDADLKQRFGAQSDPESSPESQAASKPRSRGRPKLGVTGREITLLPRHWQWLDQQRGGASATLRRLVDQERKQNPADDRVRQAQYRSNGFMSALAGDLPGFEEATRALYAGDKPRFVAETDTWPGDVKEYTFKLAADAF